MSNKTFKKTFIKLFAKREKTRRWNWILRVGVMIFALAAVLTVTAVIMTMLANIDGLKLLGMEPNEISAYTAGSACLLAVVAMFFIFCGKENR